MHSYIYEVGENSEKMRTMDCETKNCIVEGIKKGSPFSLITPKRNKKDGVFVINCLVLLAPCSTPQPWLFNYQDNPGGKPSSCFQADFVQKEIIFRSNC